MPNAPINYTKSAACALCPSYSRNSQNGLNQLWMRIFTDAKTELGTSTLKCKMKVNWTKLF